MDLGTLRLVSMFYQAPKGQTVTLYLDSVRLEGSGLPAVEGLRAYDFGPASGGVPRVPSGDGEARIHERVGVRVRESAVRNDSVYTPDDLTGTSSAATSR